MFPRFTMSTPRSGRQFFLVGGTLSLLLLSLPVLADYTPTGISRPGDRARTTAGGTRAYVPPADSRRPGENHTGGGVRGCGDDIAAIAPRLNAIGQTATGHPTFVWYNFSDDGDPVEFQLYRSKADGSFDTVVVEQIPESQPGYMAYTLPAETEALEVGETYLWQVVLYCDRSFEEVGQYSSAEVEVVNLPAELATELPADSLGRAQAYAQAGLWYEAIAEVYAAPTPETHAFRRNLLMDLADFEAQPASETATEGDLSAQLRQIAEM